MAYSFFFDFEAEVKDHIKLRKFKTQNNIEWFVQENWVCARPEDTVMIYRTKEQRFSHEISIMCEDMDRYYAEVVISDADGLYTAAKIVRRLDLCRKWILEVPFGDYKAHFIPSACTLPVSLRCTVYLFPLFHLKEPQSTRLLKRDPEGPKLKKDDETSSALPTDMKALLDKGPFSDVVVKCGAIERRAHTNILSKRSPVFAMIIESFAGKDKEQTIQLLDMGEDVFQEMLSFMYTGTTVLSSPSLARRLYTMADKYDISDLRKICSSYLHELSSKHCGKV